MICEINASLYLQTSNHSPSVHFPNLSITPGKRSMLENKAQTNCCKACSSRQAPAEQSARCAIYLSCRTSQRNWSPAHCRNSCLHCIPCWTGLPDTNFQCSRLNSTPTGLADVDKMFGKTSDLSENTCRFSVTSLSVLWHLIQSTEEPPRKATGLRIRGDNCMTIRIQAAWGLSHRCWEQQITSGVCGKT